MKALQTIRSKSRNIFFNLLKKRGYERIPQNTVEAKEALHQQLENIYLKGHLPLSHLSQRQQRKYPINIEELEKTPVRYEVPHTFAERLLFRVNRTLSCCAVLFFGYDFIRHSIVIETLAAIPGQVGGMLNHFRELMKIKVSNETYTLFERIGKQEEEAENERVHLLIWLSLHPVRWFDQLLIIMIQVGFSSFYTVLFLCSPRLAHRLAGFMEEEAVNNYTLFLKAIDEGRIENVRAPPIARTYYGLADDATIRDVVLIVRADEANHRDFNHVVSDQEASNTNHTTTKI